MTKTKYKSKVKYKNSLYTNLLVACMASEFKEEETMMEPKMLMKCREDESRNYIIPMPSAADFCRNVVDEPCAVRQRIAQRRQQTFVMRWNPEISCYKMIDFEIDMESFFDDGFYYDWSIWDHQKVHIGDRFYMLKVGEGNTGIVMSGVITSLPYKDEDWSGKGRDVRYVRMMPDCMIHPEKSPIITTHDLDEAMPGVNWNEGHSGVLLNEQQAKKFDELWQEYMNRN